MSKEFKPLLDSTDPVDPGTSFREELQRLIEERDRFKARLSELERERERLLEEVRRLKEELGEREERLKGALEEIRAHKLQRELLQEVVGSLEERLERFKEELKGDFLELSKRMIREFLLSEAVPKEELVIRILGEVFDEVVDLKGSVKVFLNPSDIERALEFIGGIRERLRDKVDIDILGSEDLRRGELRVETAKFVIERKHEEIIEEVFRGVLKDAFERG